MTAPNTSDGAPPPPVKRKRRVDALPQQKATGARQLSATLPAHETERFAKLLSIKQIRSGAMIRRLILAELDRWGL